MPQPKTRKKKPAARATAAPSAHALAAEATGGPLGFDFRGHRFTLDVGTVDFGRAMFAMKVAAKGGNVSAQFDRMLDSFEAILGVEQVGKLYDIAPDLFSSEAAQREFWEQFAKLTVGADLGEPSAS